MELTETQYHYIKGSIDRYRLSYDPAVMCSIFHDEDVNRVMTVRAQLGIPDDTKKFCHDCAIEWMHSVFKPISDLVKIYEDTLI